RRCSFVLEPFAGGFHVAPKNLDWPVVGSVEKCLRELHSLGVLIYGAPSDAGPEALLHFESNAPGRPRKNLEQLRLIGEMHFLIGGTVAKSQDVVELANGVLDPGCPHERPVVRARIVSAGAAHDDELWRRSTRDLYETVIPAVALHR